MPVLFWTIDKIEFIKNNLQMSDSELAAHFKVSRIAIKTVRQKYSIIRRFRFTDHEDKLIKKLYADTRTDVLAKQLNRKILSVYNHAFILGLKKSAEFLASPESGVFIKGSTTGREYRFPKGHVPSNKGKRMSDDVKKKVKHTFFKKGHKPHNTKANGEITIRHISKKRGQKPYQYIRLNESLWVELHRYIWEQAHGPIPEGFNVVFKDNDSLNCKLSNLELISNAELLERNRLTQWPLELQKAIKINNKLKKLIDDRH